METHTNIIDTERQERFRRRKKYRHADAKAYSGIYMQGQKDAHTQI